MEEEGEGGGEGSDVEGVVVKHILWNLGRLFMNLHAVVLHSILK